MELLFYMPQVAYKNHKILPKAQDPRLSGVPAAYKPAGIQLNYFDPQNYSLTDLIEIVFFNFINLHISYYIYRLYILNDIQDQYIPKMSIR